MILYACLGPSMTDDCCLGRAETLERGAAPRERRRPVGGRRSATSTAEAGSTIPLIDA